MKKQIAVLGLITALVVAAAATANAALDIDLGVPNSDISGYTGPYGKISVTWVDSTHATVDLTGYAGYNFSSFGVNLNATAFTASNQTGNGAGSPTYSVDTGNHSQDGFGKFNLIVDQSPSGYPGSSSMSVSILNTGGTWASVNDVLALNDTGYTAAGHVIVLNGDGTAASATGFAGNGVAPVPEPSTIIAGALLLLPFGASTIRILRKNRAA